MNDSGTFQLKCLDMSLAIHHQNHTVKFFRGGKNIIGFTELIFDFGKINLMRFMLILVDALACHDSTIFAL